MATGYETTRSLHKSLSSRPDLAAGVPLLLRRLFTAISGRGASPMAKVLTRYLCRPNRKCPTSQSHHSDDAGVGGA